jgi:hypothetical protein
MSEFRITCVQFSGPRRIVSGITHYGNHLAAPGWIREKWEMVQNYLNGERYFTQEGGLRAETGLEGAAPNQYLKTVPDRQHANNLVNLPICPSRLPTGK